MRRTYFIIATILLLVITTNAQNQRLILVKSFPDPGSEREDEFFKNPYDLIISDEHYFVTDSLQNCFKKFSVDGKLKDVIGRKGQGPGELLNPYLLSYDSIQKVISCYGTRRISLYSAKGKYLRELKSELPVWDMVSNDGKIYTSSISEVNKSLFVIHNVKTGKKQYFGRYFDSEVNKLPNKYQSYIYGHILLDIYKDKIYAFFEYLPFFQIFDLNGQLLRTINIQVKEIQKVYRNNLNPKPKGLRIGIRDWLRGASISENRIYCYIPSNFKGLAVLDLKGNLLKRLHFGNDANEKSLLYKRFIKKVGNDLIFLDGEDNQVKIYHEESLVSIIGSNS